jgi:hypothetical protein
MVGKLIGAVIRGLAKNAGTELGEMVKVKSRIFTINAVIDGRTCKECRSLHGKRIRVDSLRGNEGSITDPRYKLPRHNKCRCRTVITYESPK